MLNFKQISDVYDMKVFTDTGELCGNIEEAIMTLNKVFGWRVKSTRGSSLSRVIGGAKGVIVPHQLVKSIGDIMIISKSALPSHELEKEEEAE